MTSKQHKTEHGERSYAKELHAVVSKGQPLDIENLRELGISSSLASHYVKVGWLVRLGRGTFKLPADELDIEASLKLLARKLPGLHVGGKTALARRGVTHNVGGKARLVLWGDKSNGTLPSWFTSSFPAVYTHRQLFDENLPPQFAISALPENPDGIGVSDPERALLEMLSDVGVCQGVEEARNIMEGLVNARPDVMGTLLKHCKVVKVARLCVQWAEEQNHSWAKNARLSAGAKGKGSWVTRLSDGTILTLKP